MPDIPKPYIVTKRGVTYLLALQDGADEPPSSRFGEMIWSLPPLISRELEKLGHEPSLEVLNEVANAMRQLQTILMSNLNRSVSPEWKDESRRVFRVIASELGHLNEMRVSTSWSEDKSG
ncbi:MAG: hypothetical protein JWP09_285 [Candidatus Taylorbacteria bacterium]|nr:hypothetical protein [Candidatus Taylorbacteria bacterium]